MGLAICKRGSGSNPIRAEDPRSCSHSRRVVMKEKEPKQRTFRLPGCLDGLIQCL